MVKYQQGPLEAGLKDICPYVRKTAVMGILKLYYMDPSTVDREWSKNYSDAIKAASSSLH